MLGPGPRIKEKELAGPLSNKRLRTNDLDRRRRVIEISGSLIWSKTLMELIFNPLWRISIKSGGPSQPNPLTSPPHWGSWDLFRYFKIC